MQAQGATGVRLGHLAQAGPAPLARARAIAAADVAPQLVVARRLGDLQALLAHLRAAEPQTAGPLAPYAAYLRLMVRSYSAACELSRPEVRFLCVQQHTAALRVLRRRSLT